MNARLAGGALTLLLALAPGAAAQSVRPAAELAAAVRAHPQLTIFDDVAVGVESGVVRLSGQVTTGAKRSEVERHVVQAAGGRPVQNDIEVLPADRQDDELRYRVSRAIYGHPSFWRYASMAHPPIRIIVEHGRVTLRGVVMNNVERALARSLATGLGEASLENELRTR